MAEAVEDGTHLDATATFDAGLACVLDGIAARLAC
ncbi:hypothetical protein [Streptomyces cinnamoneus]